MDSFSKEVPARFTLSPGKCLLTGEENGTVKSFEGDNIDLLCVKSGKEIKCSQVGKPAENYDLIIDEDGLLISKSKSDDKSLPQYLSQELQEFANKDPTGFVIRKRFSNNTKLHIKTNKYNKTNKNNKKTTKNKTSKKF